MDLSIQTGKKQNKMRFLVTDLGHEDLILGYPWLATFEPRFSWADGTIDMEHLPVIVKSLNWETRCYVTVGTFARRGLGSLSNDTELSWFGVIRTKSEEDLDSF